MDFSVDARTQELTDSLRDLLQSRIEPAVPPGVIEHRQLPAPGRAQRDALRPGAAQHPADHEQPGVEQRGGVADLRVLEEGRVHRTSRVIERHEHHAAS